MTAVDLAAVQSDDALLGLIGAGHVAHSFTDASLAAVLVAWRRDVDTEAIPVLVDADTAVAVIEVNREPEPRRCSALGVVAAVLAVLIVVFCALGLMALHAHSGGLLWLLHQFLYSTGGVR